jgi:glyoxylase-like metal-dependent hydrolase (beta-lactamase superfamily II)
VAVHDFLALCDANKTPTSPAIACRLRDACEAILGGYTAGTRFGIGVDVDGLLRAGVPGVQLTWMDAKVGDRVITPRIGKPVEIQALWINALRIAGSRWSARWNEAADHAQTAFEARFVRPGAGLFDVVDVGHVSGAVDAALRPNQIFAVGGLPFVLITGEAARAVVEAVEAKLLTPLGLRSLAPDDPAYIGCYRGGPAERDGAYHQGTVWPWLMGGFVDAWLAVRGRSSAAKQEATVRFLAPLMAHLDAAGMGHVSEIADGDAPHLLAGCPFQAWSLGELIRLRRMQSPAFYRIKLGDFEVTAIHDGSLQFDPRQLLQDETGVLSSALNETLVDPHVVTISVSGFLVNTGKQLILVDAGTGGWWGGPTLGKLLVNLRAAGYKPEEVDTVLLTHLHPDHVGGITTLSGASVFSNADVRMSQIESDFWLSAKVAAKATENERGFFKIARAVSAPYLASGRWRPFAPSDRLSDGIEVVPLPGHTPGQVGYEFTSVGQRLFIMGDVVHVAEVQFKHPEIGVAFDEDQKTAVGQRERLLKRLVAQNILLPDLTCRFRPSAGSAKMVTEVTPGCRSHMPTPLF